MFSDLDAGPDRRSCEVGDEPEDLADRREVCSLVPERLFKKY